MLVNKDIFITEKIFEAIENDKYFKDDSGKIKNIKEEILRIQSDNSILKSTKYINKIF